MISIIFGILMISNNFNIELRCSRIIDFFDLKPKND